MKRIVLLFSIIGLMSCNQELTSEQVLNNAINYHDPNGNWSAFNDSLHVVMQMPNRADRVSDIYIDLAEEQFYTKAVRDTLTTIYKIDGEDCYVEFNGQTEFTEEEIANNRLSCDDALLYRDYYTYLYGLPMKLKDESTILSPDVDRTTFKEKEYLVLKATYDENVGTDIWYFYFDPETYAMEVYQFYKTDESGQLIEDSGEYIILSDTKTISEIKMPRIRKWYYNKDDGYLGADVLN